MHPTTSPYSLHSYVKLRQLPAFANSSIITMTAHDNPAAGAAAGNGSSSTTTNGHCRELAVSAELDTLVLAEVLGVALSGPETSVVSGGMPAGRALIVHVRVAGDGSTLPDQSTERTAKLCDPKLSPV